jgi:glycosyltransferase involved in cell wall biosynthesis
MSPTEWQKRQHPAAFRDKIAVIFDGVDATRLTPEPSTQFPLPSGRRLTASDEVVTYVSRNLEPYRGFPSFMRALPEILRRRPQAHIVVAGEDKVSYGREPPGGGSWREALLKEVDIDPARVHFLGRVPYDRYIDLLRVSTAHVYLTVPFVLSWSMMEAMATGCLVVGSRTPPVEEVIRDGDNGLLVDFFSPAAIAETVVATLADRTAFARLRRRARATILDKYDLARCLPAQLDLIASLTTGAKS